MKTKFKGRVWIFKDNVNTDEIIPARYLNTSDEKELAKHCMEDADKDFPKKVKKGDIIVAGTNFGCGSSREHAPISIKAAGVSCIIAKGFARIFYRNVVNIGLPILESKDILKFVKQGDIIEVDLKKGKLKNLSNKKELEVKKIPDFMEKIFSSGGLVPYIRNQQKIK